VLVVCEGDGVEKSATAVSEFLERNKVRALNVAGPRESQAPGFGRFVQEILEEVFSQQGFEY